jgi:hypothetical protein
VPLADQSTGEPLSWNLFSYVRSNPLTRVDSTGETCVPISNIDGKVTGYKDVDGPGGTCADAAIGDVEESKHPSETVIAQGPPSLALLAVARGTQMARPGVNASGVYLGVIMSALSPP